MANRLTSDARSDAGAKANDLRCTTPIDHRACKICLVETGEGRIPSCGSSCRRGTSLGTFPALRRGSASRRCRTAICNEGVSLNLLPTGPRLAGLGPDVLDACKKRGGRGAGVASARRSSRTSAYPGVRRPPVKCRLVVTVWPLSVSQARVPIGFPALPNPRDRYNRLGFCVDASRRRHCRSRPGLPSELPAFFDSGTSRAAGR